MYSIETPTMAANLIHLANRAAKFRFNKSAAVAA